MNAVTHGKSTCDHAHQHLLTQFAEHERALKLIEFNGQQYLHSQIRTSLLETLCRAIAGQQLSTKAAATIWGRVKAAQKQDARPFSRFVTQANVETLRSAGLSAAKTRTIRELAQAAEQGRLNAKQLKLESTENLVEYLCQFWGVGRWTAEMCAITYFRRVNVWSPGDVGLKNALEYLHPGDGKAQQHCIECASPFRTYWSLHLWSGLDNGFFNSLESGL